MSHIDPLATVHTERTIRELLENVVATDDDGKEFGVDWERTVGEITELFTPHFECRNGLRRLVLTGTWEVDPAAHTRSAA